MLFELLLPTRKGGLFIRYTSAVVLLLVFAALTACATHGASISPVERHGQLAVLGNRIVNQHKHPVSLAGPSLFWANKGWQGDLFFHPKTVAYLKEEWRASIIRIPVGVETNGGILHDWDGRMEKIKTVIDAAILHGLYVIIDWHSHFAEENPDAALRFFREIAQAYGNYPNIIYEIYNEPLDDTDWSTVIKPYAESVIAAIREHDPDNIIVVGTQTWSQDVDKAANDPITGFSNIAYALHFYAGTHKQELRNKAMYALNKGLALMVTEWGTVDADADGKVAKEETLRWMDFLQQNQLSHCSWAFNNKAEGASILAPDTDPAGPWSDWDLTESGLLVKDIIRRW